MTHNKETASAEFLEVSHKVRALVRREFCPPIGMDADEGEAVRAAPNQSFVPIVDSRNTLCGILTRRGVIARLAEKVEYIVRYSHKETLYSNNCKKERGTSKWN